LRLFPERDWVAAAPEQAGLDAAKLSRAMDVIRRLSGEQGTSQCVVIRDGLLVWRGEDIDNLHTVWSCTKSFLSTTLGLLIEDGKCSLDTRAADVYPPMEKQYPAVTLRHLVTFTSGYRPREASAAAAPFEPSEPLFAPGERFHYSWESYLLALLLTKIAGEPLRDLFRRRVAEPIGLRQDQWRWGDWGAFDALTGLHGAAVCGGSGLYERGVWITARALARVGWLFACGGEWDGRPLLRRSWVEQALAPQVPAATPPHEARAWYWRLPGTYGFYWWTNGIDCRGRRMWPAAPPPAAAMQGHLNNVCFVIPPWRMVVVRLGMDAAVDNDLYDEFFAALRQAIREGT
jgi:CubicO group peptidase (beta-lactamase class C family)